MAAFAVSRRPGTDLVTLDFETYFDQDYTLKKLSTSEYVRDKRFEAISCSIKINDRPTFCVLGKEAIREALEAIDWTKATLLAHHTHFDGLIASHHFGVYPAFYADTLSMGRAIFAKSERNDLDSIARRLGKGNKLKMPDIKGKHPDELTLAEQNELIEYNNADVDLCYDVYQELFEDLPEDEHRLIDMTVRLFAQPVLELDERRTRKELKREQREKQDLIKASGMSAEQLSSGPKFAAELEKHKVRVPMKRSPSDPKKQIFAFAKTDNEFTALQGHPTVGHLVKARLAVKSTIGETRAQRLLTSWKAGPLPVYLNYCGAHTTRWSGGDKMNYQNLPRGGELRKSLLAPKGWRIVVVDSSQIEARTLAWFAGETWLVEAFREGRDAYCEFASVAYGRPITKADEEERFVGKTCILGLGYSMGSVKLHLQLLSKGVVLPLEVCEELVVKYRDMNANIVNLWDDLNLAIADIAQAVEGSLGPIAWGKDYIRLPNDMFLHYPRTRCEVGVMRRNGRDEHSVYDGECFTHRGWSKLYGGLLTENVIQALARIIVAQQALEIEKLFRIVMMTHDEVAFLAREDEADKALAWAIDVMKKPPAWASDLPVSAEGTHEKFYAK